MKLNRVVFSYTLKITDESFDFGNDRKCEQTARITFRDSNKNIIEKRKYGVIDIDALYESINKGDDIDLTHCYIGNFSSNDYRNKFNLKKDAFVDINNFCAKDAFFESDKTVDFSRCHFKGEKAHFESAHFGSGNLSFYRSIFADVDVDFSNTSYSEGNNSWQYVDFGNGTFTFENASFINGNISFINADFKKGIANFKNVNFGDGSVTFQFSRFDDGNIFFDKVTFNGKNVDFSKVDFGNGKLDFRRADFGDADVSFEEMEHGNERINFRRAKFGTGAISFKMALFGDADVIFDETEFGSGNLSLLKAEARKISFKNCRFSNYADMRVEKCKVLDLSNTIIRDIIDLKPGVSKVDIDTLYIYGVKNLGKIFVSWRFNNIPKLIGQQTKTTPLQKADQYRILKEDFHDSGQYNDEDKAYVEFKRYELKYKTIDKIKKNKWSAIWAYPSAFAQKLVFDYMGLYATSPFRVLLSIYMVYGLYSLLYVLFELTGHGQISCITENMSAWEKIIDSFYFSAVTFLTIGYGECTPEGFFKIIAPLEGWIGVFMMSYFTVAFVRKILR